MPEPDAHPAYAFGPYQLFPDQRRLLGSNGEAVELRGKVFDLLWHLVRHRGQLVTKSELLEALWPGMVVEENNLNQAISALRQALDDDPKSPRYVATVKGRGYQFVGDVSREAGGETSEVSEQSSKGAALGFGFAVIAIALVAVPVLFWTTGEQATPGNGATIIDNFANAAHSLVTDYPGSHSAPALSPDGRTMAYVSDASGTPQIWIRNVLRGEPVQLTEGPYPAGEPNWSPHSDQLLFVRSGPGGRTIDSVSSLGRSAPVVIVEGATSPAYSREGDAFVFARGRDIWIARNDGRDREKIIGVPVGDGFAPREPALSRDGTQVAFIHADAGPLGNLWIIPAAGGEARQLTDMDAGDGDASAPAWSADGRYIVFSVDADTGGGQLWRYELASGSSAPLTASASGARDAALSGDGKSLLYTATRTQWLITRVNPRTAETATIHVSRAPVYLPVVSRDHKRLIFFTRDSSGTQLRTINSNGSGLRQLTFDEGGENNLPVWAGDDASILYYRGQALHRLNPADGSDTEIFGNFPWSTHIWLAAHDERITYHIVDRKTGQRQTLVRSMNEDAPVALPVPVESAQWSADGQELLGWFRRTGELLVCRANGSGCRNIEHEGSNIKGAYPRWSLTEQEIYFLRSSVAGGCCTLWRVNRDGSEEEPLAELNGFDSTNSYYGLDANGHIIYNHADHSTDEIWRAAVP
jgi:Tol biopolymer transport system component/DNA-binding winged helix-turn-helix (wHTH) protein